MFWKVPGKNSLSSGRSREDQKIKAWRNYFLVIAIFRYIPSLRDEWEGSILWVSPEKFVPQVVGHEKGEKLSFVEGFLSPLTNLGMGSTVFTGVVGKNFSLKG